MYSKCHCDSPRAAAPRRWFRIQHRNFARGSRAPKVCESHRSHAERCAPCELCAPHWSLHRGVPATSRNHSTRTLPPLCQSGSSHLRPQLAASRHDDQPRPLPGALPRDRVVVDGKLHPVRRQRLLRLRRQRCSLMRRLSRNWRRIGPRRLHWGRLQPRRRHEWRLQPRRRQWRCMHPRLRCMHPRLRCMHPRLRCMHPRLRRGWRMRGSRRHWRRMQPRRLHWRRSARRRRCCHPCGRVAQCPPGTRLLRRSWRWCDGGSRLRLRAHPLAAALVWDGCPQGRLGV